MVTSILKECGFDKPRKIFKEQSQVAFVEEKPVALLLASPAKQSPLRNLAGQSLQIDQFAVLPEYRKRGLGSQLMNHFMTQWALHMNIHLDCFEEWLEDFQANFGFEVTSHKAEKHEEPELRTSMICKSWTSQNSVLKDQVDTIFERHRDGTLVS